MRRVLCAVIAASCSVLVLPSPAHASSAAAFLTGGNGEGSFVDTLDCAEGGDGDSFRYAWQDQPSGPASGLFAGTWNGSFEVHEAGRGPAAFVPRGDGRLSITLAAGGERRGTGGLDTTADGSCADAPLTLGTQPDGDPEVTGTLPVTATGGTGALRGLTGTGAIAFTLELGPGADNLARIDLTGNLDVAAPTLAVGTTQARYLNLSEYFAKRVRLAVEVRNTGPGDAYGARLTSVSGATGRFGGLPTSAQTIPAGQSRTFGLVMDGARLGSRYTINATTGGQDGLLAAQPPTTGSSTFTTPLFP
ncbi:MAG: hypothetical protein WKF96_08450 [Solirubrobacteraceae bacterium]